MPETLTAKYEFVKPEVGIVGSPTQWSERLNEDLDSIDTVLADLQTQIDTLAPDAPVGLTERIETLERMLNGRRVLRRVEINTSTTINLADGPADGIWITATGSGSKVITLQAPDADQTVDGTADGTFTLQEGILVIQNLGSGSISYTGLNASISWVDGDGGGIGAQSTPGGLLRFYKWYGFFSTGSSESPPSNRIYLLRLAL